MTVVLDIFTALKTNWN